jgi:hypothetical protein
VGLLAIGLALGDAAEAPAWRSRAARAIAREARRQVCGDGAAFEGSTSYHRFTLELLLAADRLAGAARLGLELGATLCRMFGFVAAYLGPDGEEPGFGDGDDGRVLPLVARPPRAHGYLLPLGAVHLGDATLKRADLGYAEEAAWLGGLAGYRAWQSMPEAMQARSASFPDGGVHVLRAGGEVVALRAGPAGQRGVGGHAHNDQLSIAVWLDGRPLVVDPGTACYAADPAWRDRFRGTAAHATVVVDGEEQSRLYDGRMFALPDAARGELVALEELGGTARMVARHAGYRRLRGRVVHRREVRLERAMRAVVVSDVLDGRGERRPSRIVRFVRRGVLPWTSVIVLGLFGMERGR